MKRIFDRIGVLKDDFSDIEQINQSGSAISSIPFTFAGAVSFRLKKMIHRSAVFVKLVERHATVFDDYYWPHCGGKD